MLRTITNAIRQGNGSGLGSILHKHNPPTGFCQHRYFLMRLLDAATNKYEHSRVEELGTNRVCAEWIVRTGGRIRWKGSDIWVADYNSLPPDQVVDNDAYRLQDIDASHSNLMQSGFALFAGLEDLKSVKFHDCKYVDDRALTLLSNYHLYIEKLQVSSCKHVTDGGLMNLIKFKMLSELHLKDLPGVKDPANCCKKLKESLPNCEVLYVQPNQ